MIKTTRGCCSWPQAKVSNQKSGLQLINIASSTMICHVFLHTLGGSFLAMDQDHAQKNRCTLLVVFDRAHHQIT